MPTSKGVKINLSLEAADAANSLDKIKRSIKDLKSLSLEVGEGGKGFDALTKKANELQDKLGDLKDATSIQGTSIEKMNKSFSLLTESFNNLDLGKAKLGFKSLFDTLTKSGPQIILFVLFDVVKSIIENFDKLINLFPALGTAVQAITDAFHWLTDKLKITSKTQRELEEQGKKLIEQAEKSKVALENQTSEYDRQIAVAKAAGKSTVQVELDKQDAIIRTNKAYLEQVIAHGRAGGQISAEQLKLVNEQLNAIKDAEAQKIAITETTEKTKREENKKTYEENKKLSEKKAEKDAKKHEESVERNAEMAKLEQDNYEAQLEQIIAIDEAKEKSTEIQLGQNNELINSAVKTREQIDANNKAYVDLTNSIVGGTQQAVSAFSSLKTPLGDVAASITNSFSTAFDTISDKQATTTDKIQAGLSSVASMISAISQLQKQLTNEEIDSIESRTEATINSLNTQRDAELNQANLTSSKKTAIQQKYAMQEYKLKLDAYNKETAIKKKSFEQSKKMSIATTIIQGAMGAISAFNSLSVIPVVGTILGVIAAAAVGVMTAVQVSKISKTKFEESTPPSPPQFQMPDVGATVSSQSAPSTASSAISNKPELEKIGLKEEDSKKEPVQVYVVSQEITSAQDKQSIIERRASF